MIDCEKDLDRKLSKEIKKQNGKGDKIDYKSIPDFWYSFTNTIEGFCGWIENKIVDCELDKIKYQPGQATFLITNYQVVRTWVLVYNKANSYFYLFLGSQARKLEQKPLAWWKPELQTKNISEIVKCLKK